MLEFSCTHTPRLVAEKYIPACVIAEIEPDEVKSKSSSLASNVMCLSVLSCWGCWFATVCPSVRLIWFPPLVVTCDHDETAPPTVVILPPAAVSARKYRYGFRVAGSMGLTLPTKPVCDKPDDSPRRIRLGYKQ